MDNLPDTNFVVYVRNDERHHGRMEIVETRTRECSSYSEARQVQREYRRMHQDAVIRFEGVTGGGD